MIDQRISQIKFLKAIVRMPREVSCSRNDQQKCSIYFLIVVLLHINGTLYSLKQKYEKGENEFLVPLTIVSWSNN